MKNIKIFGTPFYIGILSSDQERRQGRLTCMYLGRNGKLPIACFLEECLITRLRIDGRFVFSQKWERPKVQNRLSLYS
jgi:hypothetical protein